MFSVVPDRLKSVLNEALAQNLILDGSVSQAGVDLDYAVELKSFEGDGTSLATKWTVDLTSNTKSDTCGGRLSYTSERSASEELI